MAEPTFAYEGCRRVVYGDEEGATFVPVCPHCRRFVRPDKNITMNGFYEVKAGPNARCAKCGRVEMPFEGYL